MGLLESIVGGGVGKLVKDVVGTFRLTPEAKAEIDKQIEDHRFELEKLDREYDTKILDIQGKEIDAAREVVKAELATGDKYTSRARPTFVYVCLGVIVHNYVVLSYMNRPPIDFPDALFDTMTMILLGIVGGRSIEKVMRWRSGGK